MRALTRFLAFGVALTGLVLAGWGPVVFEALTGRALPAPIATDAAAMTAWSGIAFLRVLGAALGVLGAVAGTLLAKEPSLQRAWRVLAGTTALTAVLVLAQTWAVWGTMLGGLLAGAFAVLALVGVAHGWSGTAPSAASHALAADSRHNAVR